MTKWCAPNSRFDRWGRHSCLAASRLVSTRVARVTGCRTRSVPMSGDAAGMSACATGLLPPGVEFVDARAEVLHGAGAADLHGGGELAILDGEIAAQDAVLAHLLEGGELFVDAQHGLLDLREHGRRSCHLGGRTAFPRLHALQGFGDGKVDV